MILVDSSVWIDFFNGKENPHTSILMKALEDSEALVGDLVIAEVLQGFKSEEEASLAEEAFKTIPWIELGGLNQAFNSAANYRFLRKRGITIRKTMDMLIATWAIENEVFLLHKDADFDRIASALPLKVVPTE